MSLSEVVALFDLLDGEVGESELWLLVMTKEFNES